MRLDVVAPWLLTCLLGCASESRPSRPAPAAPTTSLDGAARAERFRRLSRAIQRLRDSTGH